MYSFSNILGVAKGGRDFRVQVRIIISFCSSRQKWREGGGSPVYEVLLRPLNECRNLLRKKQTKKKKKKNQPGQYLTIA